MTPNQEKNMQQTIKYESSEFCSRTLYFFKGFNLIIFRDLLFFNSYLPCIISPSSLEIIMWSFFAIPSSLLARFKVDPKRITLFIYNQMLGDLTNTCINQIINDNESTQLSSLQLPQELVGGEQALENELITTIVVSDYTASQINDGK